MRNTASMPSIHRPRINRRSLLQAALAAPALAASATLLPRAALANTDQGLIDQARITVEGFAGDTNFGDLRRRLPNARGVMIFPQLIKGSFIIGGEGGSGLLLARNNGVWSQPAIYTLAAGSIGFQIGGEVSEVIFMLNTEKAVDAILRNEFKLGADASVAAGPVGAGIEASTTSNLGTDILSYARSKGLAAGISLEGAVITARHSRNEAYYGRSAHPRDILYNNAVNNPGSQGLISALQAAEQRA